MKKRFLPLILIVMLTFVSCLGFVNKIEEDVDLNFDVISDGISNFEIDVRNGFLTVKGWEGSSIKIEGKRYVQGMGNLEDELSQISLASRQRGNQQRIYIDYPKYMETKIGFNFGYSITVFIPNSLYESLLIMSLDTSNGDITMNDFYGDIVSDTSNAKIYHENISGKVHADTSNGEIILNNINGTIYADTSNARIAVEKSNGSIELDTSNGPVFLKNVNGDIVADTSNAPVSLENCTGNIVVDTSSGKVSLINVTGEIKIDSSNAPVSLSNCVFIGSRNEIDSSNGSITGSLTLPESGKFVIKTTNGDIKLMVPAYSNARYTADTSNGDIRIENIPVTIIDKDRTDEEGFFNADQGVSLELDTSNGDITVIGQ
jgi:DUF4097 and DUF4098 domain-containing protein YvlB